MWKGFIGGNQENWDRSKRGTSKRMIPCDAANKGHASGWPGKIDQSLQEEKFMSHKIILMVGRRRQRGRLRIQEAFASGGGMAEDPRHDSVLKKKRGEGGVE